MRRRCVRGLSGLRRRRNAGLEFRRWYLRSAVTRMVLRRGIIRRRVARSRRLPRCVCRGILTVWRCLFPRVRLRRLLMQLGRVSDIRLLRLNRVRRHDGPRRCREHAPACVLGVGICEVCREPGPWVALANRWRSSTSRVARRRS